MIIKSGSRSGFKENSQKLAKCRQKGTLAKLKLGKKTTTEAKRASSAKTAYSAKRAKKNIHEKSIAKRRITVDYLIIIYGL